MQIPQEEAEMIIAVDKAQKEGKHDIKHNQLIDLGHELVFLPLPVGDYILVTDAVNEVIDILTPEAFYLDKHQKIFDAIK